MASPEFRREIRLAAVVASAGVLIVAIVLGHGHRMLLVNVPAAAGSVEWDFYYSYARDARRIASLLPPLDEFRGPLYPLVIALVHAVFPTASLFTVAKVVSAASAALAVFITYRLAEEFVAPAYALAAGLATAATSSYVVLGTLAATDMFFAALSLASIVAVARSLAGHRGAIILAGLLQGLALSTRWNAVFLPAATLALLLFGRRPFVRTGLRDAAIFASALLAALAPWLALNGFLHGNPLFNLNGVNAGIGIYDQHRQFNSLTEAFTYAPAQFLRRWVENIATYAGRIGDATLPFSILSIAGFVVLAIRGRRARVLWIPIVFAATILAVNAVGPYVPRQYLAVLPMLFIGAAAALQVSPGRTLPRRALAITVAIAWIAGVVWLAARSVGDVRRIRESEGLSRPSRDSGPETPTPLAGDWAGAKRDQIGVAVNGDGYKVFYLLGSDASGAPQWIAAYGPHRGIPIAGHWRRQARDGIGVFAGGAFFLKREAFSGFADTILTFGDPAGLPVAGDWNGDGIDTVGTFHDGVFTITDSNAAPLSERSFSFGAAGDLPVVGDWDGDGRDTFGVYRDGVFTLTNRHAAPFDDTWRIHVDISEIAGAQPLSADRMGSGRDAPVLFLRDGTFVFLETGGDWSTRIDLAHLDDMPTSGR